MTYLKEIIDKFLIAELNFSMHLFFYYRRCLPQTTWHLNVKEHNKEITLHTKYTTDTGTTRNSSELYPINCEVN